MLFTSMIEIIDVIAEQIFEKVNTIPYIIRQFCKCLYQALKEKFLGSKPAADFDVRIVRVVSSFLFEKWILHAIFNKLHLEGLIKDFILPKHCILNLQLMNQILLKTMTWQEWEVATPQSERLPGMPAQDLFTMPPDVSQSIRSKSRQFFRDLLFLNRDMNSVNSLQ